MSSSSLTKAVPAGQISAAVTTAQLFPNKQVPSAPTVINVLGSGRLEQKKFTVRASGSVVTGTTATVTPTLYMGLVIPATPFTAGNWTILGAGGAVSLASISSAWAIETTLYFESLGGTMQGSFSSEINNAITAAAAITNRLTGLNGTSNSITQEPSAVLVTAAEPVFVIAVGLTFSVANAGNIGTLGDFCLDG
jgi:hypothetical protein